MRHIGFTLDDEVAAELGTRAADEGISKSAVVRRILREKLGLFPPLEQDPLWRIVGMIRGSGDDSSRIDEVVYGSDR
jgi:hypothetical protein